jgi:hypothetical protein
VKRYFGRSSKKLKLDVSMNSGDMSLRLRIERCSFSV